ncbi:undecaprenyldiphospho-muramoylpentapeptide beta-N-acetylglucosaminyltransferase [Patescibacteria group bacterium]|nr:undecaprenyldiphospho-muramoylpentapeptide beta-N-acetylglucosaminyltransferase [Patescibacteria group bacterium]
MRILFTGGGTGGHVYPLIAVIRETRKLYPKKDLEFFYIGPEDEFGSILLSQEDVIVKTISSGKIRRYFSFQNIIDALFKIPLGIIQSFFYIIKIKPQIVFSKGGSGSILVTFCAKIFRIPIFIHESDIIPGLSNKMTSKWARKIFISFPKTEYFDLDKTILVGNPVRSEILNGNKEKAIEMFNLTLQKPVIFFSGGSQGAEFINDFVLRILNSLLQEFEVIHLCGPNNLKQVQAEAQAIINKDLEPYYHPYAFLDEEKLKNAYRAADFIISRAGSGSIFEIAAIGIPSILVPLPSAAGNHQARNAYSYAETGAALVMEQDNLTENFFLEKLHYLLMHQKKLDKMKEEALRFSKPYAAKTIARTILEYLMLE